jgi:hypothetical protein
MNSGSMPFSRVQPTSPSGSQLDAALRSIGVRIGRVAPQESADIELTLVAAVERALPRDYRLLGVLLAWLAEHQARVNVPRLRRMIREGSADPLVRAFWSAVATWLKTNDIRWRPLVSVYRGKALDLDDPEITRLQLKRVGSDSRFLGSALRVHAKLLRSRVADVDTREQLASRHAVYRRRIEMGPSYRADAWAALEQRPAATPAQVARQIGCAYETARATVEDFRLWMRAAPHVSKSA